MEELYIKNEIFKLVMNSNNKYFEFVNDFLTFVYQLANDNNLLEVLVSSFIVSIRMNPSLFI